VPLENPIARSLCHIRYHCVRAGEAEHRDDILGRDHCEYIRREARADGECERDNVIAPDHAHCVDRAAARDLREVPCIRLTADPIRETRPDDSTDLGWRLEGQRDCSRSPIPQGRIELPIYDSRNDRVRRRDVDIEWSPQLRY